MTPGPCVDSAHLTSNATGNPARITNLPNAAARCSRYGGCNRRRSDGACVQGFRLAMAGGAVMSLLAAAAAWLVIAGKATAQEESRRLPQKGHGRAARPGARGRRNPRGRDCISADRGFQNCNGFPFPAPDRTYDVCADACGLLTEGNQACDTCCPQVPPTTPARC